MPAARQKTPKAPKVARPVRPPRGSVPDVLTLPEAAAYLRIREAALEELARKQELPGRMIDGEWRFLRSALQEWLTEPLKAKRHWVSLAGAWKDDPTLAKMLSEIEERRARASAADDRE